MKKIFWSLIIFACGMNLVLAEEIGLKNVQTQKVEYTPKIQKETKELTIDEDTALKGIVNLQQKKDLEDIDMLWKATVENNNIIKFAMKKLSVPPNQRDITLYSGKISISACKREPHLFLQCLVRII